MQYEMLHSAIIPDIDNAKVRYLKCKCGRIPMGTPRDASTAIREVMRLCAGCDGVVNVPLHHLDGTTHLACIPGRVSQALLDENGLVAESVKSEVLGIALDESCSVHPVRTVAERVICLTPKKGNARGSAASAGSTEMRYLASMGRNVGLPTSRGMTMRPPGSLENEMRLPESVQARGLQQRPVPMARMVPSSKPEESLEDDRSSSQIHRS